MNIIKKISTRKQEHSSLKFSKLASNAHEKKYDLSRVSQYDLVSTSSNTTTFSNTTTLAETDNRYSPTVSNFALGNKNTTNADADDASKTGIDDSIFSGSDHSDRETVLTAANSYILSRNVTKLSPTIGYTISKPVIFQKKDEKISVAEGNIPAPSIKDHNPGNDEVEDITAVEENPFDNISINANADNLIIIGVDDDYKYKTKNNDNHSRDGSSDSLSKQNFSINRTDDDYINNDTMSISNMNLDDLMLSDVVSVTDQYDTLSSSPETKRTTVSGSRNLFGELQQPSPIRQNFYAKKLLQARRMKDNNLKSVKSSNTQVEEEENYYTVDQLRYLPTPKEFTNFEELMNSEIVRDVLKSSLKAKKYQYLRNLADSLNEVSRSRYSHKLKQLEEGDTASSSAASTCWRTIKSNPSTMKQQKGYPPNSNVPYRTNTLVSGMSFDSNVSNGSTISSQTQLSYHSKWSDASDRSDNSDVHPDLSSASTMLVDEFLARLESNLKQFPIFEKRADQYNIIRALPIISEKFKSGYTVFPSTSSLKKYQTYNTFMDKSLKVIRDIRKKNELAIKQYNKNLKTKDESIIEKSELARMEKFNNIENDIKFIRELDLLKPLFKVVLPNFSVIRKNCPIVTIYKYLTEEQIQIVNKYNATVDSSAKVDSQRYVYCKMYDKRLKCSVQRYTLEFTPNWNPNLSETEKIKPHTVIMFDHDHKPYCDVLYKGTKLRWLGTSVRNNLSQINTLYLVIPNADDEAFREDIAMNSTYFPSNYSFHNGGSVMSSNQSISSSRTSIFSNSTTTSDSSSSDQVFNHLCDKMNTATNEPHPKNTLLKENSVYLDYTPNETYLKKQYSRSDLPVLCRLMQYSSGSSTKKASKAGDIMIYESKEFDDINPTMDLIDHETIKGVTDDTEVISCMALLLQLQEGKKASPVVDHYNTAKASRGGYR